MALAMEDDLEDLARGRRGVQYHDPQLSLHARASFMLCFAPACTLPPVPVPTVSVACLPHVLLMSVHRAHTPVHDSLTAYGKEGTHALPMAGEAMPVEGEGSFPLFGDPGR